MSRIDHCNPRPSHGCGDNDNHKSSRSSRSDGEKTVRFGDDTFNVNDEDNRAALEEALFNADTDARYDPDSNKVTVGRKTYDLDDASGREAFRKDARDGELDGKARNKDSRSMNLDGDVFDLRTDAGREQLAGLVEGEHGEDGARYDQEDNIVTVERDNGRDRDYNLDTAKGRRDFERDISDGKLDGEWDRKAARELQAEKREARRGEDSRGCDEPVNKDRLDDSARSDASEGSRRSSRSNGSHLRDIEFNGRFYDLRKPAEEESFRKALMSDPNVTYIEEDNMVMVGDKTYDLDDPEQFHAFRQDMADGKLDGVPAARSRRGRTIKSSTGPTGADARNRSTPPEGGHARIAAVAPAEFSRR